MKRSLPRRLPRPVALGAVVLACVAGVSGAEGALQTLGRRPGATPAPAGPAYWPQRNAKVGVAGAATALHAAPGTPSMSGRPLAPAARAASPAGGAGGSAANGTTGQALVASPVQRIRQTGSMTVVVGAQQVQADLQRLSLLATAGGGFVASATSQAATPGAPAQGTVVLEVPYAQFATTVAQVHAMGRVSSLSTSADDLTGQYVDLRAQIAALQASQRQYLAIMTRATTIGGVLAVQEQLDSLQSQLQQTKAQLALVDHETTYSSLTVTVTERAAPPVPKRPPSSWDKAWTSAVNGFVAGCQAAVRATGPLAFVALLLGVLYWVARSGARLLRRRGARPAEGAGA